MARTIRKAPASLPRVMRFKRAAVESGFSYGGLRDAYFRGEISIVKCGQAWYVELDEMKRFVEANTERRKTG